jgi:hypothetical protein
MTHLQVLLIATLTWIVWVPAAALDKHARGDSGAISIAPVLPLFPLAAWGLAYLLHSMNLPIGVTLVGAAHLVLLVYMIVSMVRSKSKIRRQTKASTDSSNPL